MEIITKGNLNLNAVDNVNEFIDKPNLDFFVQCYLESECSDDENKKNEIKNNIYELNVEIKNLLINKRIDLIINKYVFFDETTGLMVFMFLLAESLGKNIENVSDFKNAIMKNLKYPAHFKNLFRDNDHMTQMFNVVKDNMYSYSMAHLVRNQVEYNVIDSYNPQDFGLSNEGWDVGYGKDNMSTKDKVIKFSFILGIDEIEFLEDEEIKKYALIYNTDFEIMKDISYQNVGFKDAMKDFQNQLNMDPELRDLLFAELEAKYPKLKELKEQNKDSQSS